MAESNDQTFEIQDFRMNIDIGKTRNLYSQEVKIIDNCSCEDCHFYATVFINNNLEIFRILTSVGVDLEKNVKSQPGVWFVQDEKGNFCYCEQECRLHGSIISKGVSQFKYSRKEQGLEIAAVFAQNGIENIDIYLTIELEKD